LSVRTRVGESVSFSRACRPRHASVDRLTPSSRQGVLLGRLGLADPCAALRYVERRQNDRSQLAQHMPRWLHPDSAGGSTRTGRGIARSTSLPLGLAGVGWARPSPIAGAQAHSARPEVAVLTRALSKGACPMGLSKGAQEGGTGNTSGLEGRPRQSRPPGETALVCAGEDGVRPNRISRHLCNFRGGGGGGGARSSSPRQVPRGVYHCAY